MFRMTVATLKDAAKIADLVNSAYRGESSEQGWTTESQLLGGQRTDPVKVCEMIQDPQSVILISHDQGKIKACVYLQKKTDSAYLGMLTVDPQEQSQGTGKQILAAAEDFTVKTWHLKKIEMTVITLRSELIAWYERRGYQRTGQYEPFPYGDIRFGVPLRDDLEFEVLVKNLT